MEEEEVGKVVEERKALVAVEAEAGKEGVQSSSLAVDRQRNVTTSSEYFETSSSCVKEAP